MFGFSKKEKEEKLELHWERQLQEEKEQRQRWGRAARDAFIALPRVGWSSTITASGVLFRREEDEQCFFGFSDTSDALSFGYVAVETPEHNLWLFPHSDEVIKGESTLQKWWTWALKQDK